MGKNKNVVKAAKKEEKKTPVVENKNVANATSEQPVDNTAKVEDVENVKKPEVENIPKKEEASENKEAKKPKNTSKKYIAEVIPEEIQNGELTKVLSKVPIGSHASSFDAKANLAFVMNDRYAHNKELAERYPEFYEAMSHNIDVVTVLALVDLQNELRSKNERGEIKLTIDPSQVIQLNEAANLLGITLESPKTLPGATDGQLSLNFSPEQVPEELHEDKESTDSKVNLDPTKVTSDEELNASLAYILKKRSNVVENIIDMVEFYRTYCLTKEENADKKLEIDNKTSGELIDEIFKRIKTTPIFNGFGGAMYNSTYTSGSPVRAHCCTFINASKKGWSEQQTADLVKAFITGKYKLKVQAKETSDNPNDNKAVSAIIGTLGTEYIDKIFSDLSSEDKQLSAEAKCIVGIVKNTFFKGMNPSVDDVRIKIGQIINLYRDPLDRIAEAAFCQKQTDEESNQKTEKKN